MENYKLLDYDNLHTNAPRQILELLFNSKLKAFFNSFYEGDPVLIGKSRLPALIVEWETADPLDAPTRHDKWQQGVAVKIVLNKMDDAKIDDANPDGIIETTTRKVLQRVVFARDDTTKQYKDDTVLGVLRKNYTLNGNVNQQVARVEFGVSNRPGGDGSNTITAEAHVNLTLSETIQVPDRK